MVQALHFAMIDRADEFQLVNFVLQFKASRSTSNTRSCNP